MQTNLQVSNIHKAYGDDSVYQVLVGYDKHVKNGKSTSDWTNCGYVKIRAVKDSNGLYLAVIRSSEGDLLFKGRSIYEFPEPAIGFGISVYKSKFML